MKKYVPSLVAVAVWATLYSAYSLANNTEENRPEISCLDQQCLANVPVYTKPLVEGDIKTLPVEVETDTFTASAPNTAVYEGNVVITQGNRSVEADKVTIETKEDQSRVVTISGDINYLDNVVTLQGEQASMNLDTNDIEIKNSQYHLVGRLGRGQASQLQLESNRYITLKDGSFTSCPVDDNSWNIQGSTVIHDNEEELVEIWNAVFKIGPVPVLYSPYLQFPVGDRRRSGLLIPSFNYDSIDGVNIATPFYWNIAPNLDATFTPRLIQRRGVQLQTEARYLTSLGQGVFALDWLHHDSLYNKDRRDPEIDTGDNKERWLFHWEHKGLIDQNWRIETDMTRVSDVRYFTDLSSNYGSMTDGYITQRYLLGYANNNWDVALSSKSFQVFRSTLKDNMYRTVPQLDIRYYSNPFDSVKFNTYAQAVRFTSPGVRNPEITRLHIAPTVSYNVSNQWSMFNADATLLATHYYQDVPGNNYSVLQKDVNRVMPHLNLDGRIIFERDNIPFLDGYTQTLEPRIKYQYIPYRNQSRIQNTDSSLLQSDYAGLFRDHLYSGLDRIASANQLSTGLTTRFYDNNLVERFNFSLGQVYYFNKSRTGDLSSPLDQNEDTGSLTWATDGFWRVNDNLIMRGGLQYDTRIDEVALANGVIEYRASQNKLAQLSYRYANKNYIDAIGLITNSPYKQDISQVGLMASWPLTDTLSVVGSYYYDTKLEQSSDSFIGFQYNSCCWGFSVQYGRKITDWNASTQTSQYDNKLSFNFELRGLSTNRNTTAKMLDFGLLPYQSAFEEN
ncbi:LPS assembly protein LptD [Zophobihabitans entericus]|uniref:LPS-assembly protein LptD n=1 Tax=Zophobihabitans entericus TaxID=1635327 RepID=A0A6G9IBP4_9GAMM|nr:LPS assembly protein LptD [Zophobihabitans entericus]QIQ21656.1 LPS assembly protein LptD [Zophobihabitans entericus]